MGIDILLAELKSNNELIRAPLESFWSIARETRHGSLQDLFERVTAETSFQFSETPYGLDKRFPKTADAILIGEVDYHKILDILDHFGLPDSVDEDLQVLMTRNSQILKELLAYELGQRFSAGYLGDYPFCGLDVGAVSQLGGIWNLIEPFYAETDFLERLLENPQDRQKYDDEKIRVTQKYCPTDECDVLLLKCTTPAREVLDVINDYRGRVRHLMISTQSDLPLSPVDLVSMPGKSGFKSEQAFYDFGGLEYPLHEFYLYEPF